MEPDPYHPEVSNKWFAEAGLLAFPVVAVFPISALQISDISGNNIREDYSCGGSSGLIHNMAEPDSLLS